MLSTRALTYSAGTVLNVHVMSSPHRIFSSAPLSLGEELSLEDDRARYVSRSLRLKPGDCFVLFDGNGGEYRVAITRISRARVDVVAEAFEERNVESPLTTRLLQGIAKGERMDTVVQKSTELGVTKISPLITEHTVVRLDADKAARRTAHWQRVAISACEQCGRNKLPQVDPPQSLASVLEQPATPGDQRIVLSPTATTGIGDAELRQGPTTLLIGPEGGLSPVEIERATNAGFIALSMGPRVLRTETAAIAALAVLQARLGDM